MTDLFKTIRALLTSDTPKAPSVLPGRNDDCWCGSGRKYKKCHMHEDEKKTAKACSLNCGPT